MPFSLGQHAILGALQSVPIRPKTPGTEPAPPPLPFITVSRQPGAGAVSMAQLVIEDLNRGVPPEAHWTCWDRELVEKVAADFKLSTSLVESLEEADRSWIMT